MKKSRRPDMTHDPECAQRDADWQCLSPAVVALLLILPLIAVIAVVYRQHFGFGLSSGSGDEGLYISSAVRYMLGDKPFADEHFMTATSFDLVDFVIFRLTGANSLLTIRWIGVGASVFAAGICCVALRRRISALALSLLFTALVTYSPFNLWTPNYKSLSQIFLLLSGVLFFRAWYAGSSRREALLLAASTGSFTLAIVCYATLVFLIPLPLIMTFVWIRANGFPKANFRLVLTWYGWLACFVLCVAFVVLSNGAGGQILSNIRERSLYPIYHTTLPARFWRKFFGHGLFKEMATTGAWIATCLACFGKNASDP